MNDIQSSIYHTHIDVAAEAIAARAAGKKGNKNSANVMMQLRKAAIHPLLFREIYTDAKIKQMSHAILKEDAYRSSEQQYVYEDMEVMNDLELNRLCTSCPKTLGRYALKKEEWMNSGKVKKL